jgi:hypothetical protein
VCSLLRHLYTLLECLQLATCPPLNCETLKIKPSYLHFELPLFRAGRLFHIRNVSVTRQVFIDCGKLCFLTIRKQKLSEIYKFMFQLSSSFLWVATQGMLVVPEERRHQHLTGGMKFRIYFTYLMYIMEMTIIYSKSWKFPLLNQRVSRFLGFKQFFTYADYLFYTESPFRSWPLFAFSLWLEWHINTGLTKDPY